MDYKEWYLPDNENKREALQYEILSNIRPKLTAILGEERKDRHLNIGTIGSLKKELRAKYKQDNPAWDFYNSIEYVAKTKQVTRKELKEKLDEGQTYQEIAEAYGTHEELIQEKARALKKNQLGKEFRVPIDFTKKWGEVLYESPSFDIPIDIDGDQVISQRKGISKEKVEERYTLKEIIQAAHREAQKITDFYDKHNTPYSVRFSGGRGFHIVIPRSQIENYIENQRYSEYCRHWASFIQEKTDAIIDNSIYKDKQIFRTPYTMHTDTHLICMPLTRQQFQDFELKYVSPDYIRNNIDLYKRGNQTRNGTAAKLLIQYKEYRNQIEEQPTRSQTDSRQRKVQKHVKQLQELDPETRKQIINEVKE